MSVVYALDSSKAKEAQIAVPTVEQRSTATGQRESHEGTADV